MTVPDLPAALGNIEVLGAVTPGGLPYPVSSDPANQGANDIKALALAMDGKLPTLFTQSFTAGAMPANSTTYALNVPIGKLLMISTTVTWRLPAGQYGNIQWFDAGVQVGTSAGPQAPSGAGATAAYPATAVLSWKFGGAPTFNIFCSVAMSVDPFKVSGLIFG